MNGGQDAASGRSDLCAAGQGLSASDRPNDLMELDMFVTAKLKLLSGMVIGAGAVMVMTKMCKQRRKHRRSAPVVSPQD